MKSPLSALCLTLALAACVPAHVDGPSRRDDGSWPVPRAKVVPKKPGIYITENPDGTITTTIVEPHRPTGTLPGFFGTGAR